MSIVKVSSKGQITLPKEVREDLGIKPGGKLRVLTIGGQVVLIPISEDPIRALKASIKFKKPIAEIMREIREEEKLRESRLQRMSKR